MPVQSIPLLRTRNVYQKPHAPYPTPALCSSTPLPPFAPPVVSCWHRISLQEQTAVIPSSFTHDNTSVAGNVTTSHMVRRSAVNNTTHPAPPLHLSSFAHHSPQFHHSHLILPVLSYIPIIIFLLPQNGYVWMSVTFRLAVVRRN